MKKYKLLALFTLISVFHFSQTNSSSYYIEKAIESAKKEKLNKAFKILDKGIKKMPDSILLYDYRAALCERYRIYDEALKFLTIAIDKTEDEKYKSQLLVNRGGTKYRIRDFEGSYSDLFLATQLDSTNIDALNNLAAVSGDLNKSDEAIELYLKILSIDSNYHPAYINLGFEYQSKEKHERAITFFNKAILLEPKNALCFSNRSFSKLKLNELNSAMADILYSIQLMPSNSYAFKIKGLIEIEKGEIKCACDDFTQSLKLGYTNQYGEEVNALKSKYCK